MLKLIKNIFWRKIEMFKINQEKLIKHINSTWMTKTCPYCGKNDWNLGDNIVSAINIGDNKELCIGGKFQPLIPVTCNVCGNTVFVNALVAKAVDMDEEEH